MTQTTFVFTGYKNFVDMLIENDVDVNIKNGDGNTALDVANEEGKEQQ